MSRRYRRRRQLAILLTLGVVITVVALAVSYRTEQRETTEYLALAGEVTKSELAVSESLQDLLASLGGLDRPSILGRIDALEEQANEIDAALAEAVVPRPVAEVHGYLTVAVGSWHSAITGMEEAFTEAMDQPANAEGGYPAVLLVETFDRLRTGDFAYGLFLEGAAALDPELEAPTYPEIAFLAGDDPIDVAAIATRLRGSRNLDERHDVRVTANTLPEPVDETNEIMIMPFLEQFDVTAVVTNSGNVVQEEIQVTFELVLDGADEPFVERRIISALDPGTSDTLDFLGVALEPGALYNLQVVADIPDDANPDNNIWTIRFLTNEQ